MSQKHIIREKSPDKVWYLTGCDLWASRAWKPKERAAYCREVLGREPYAFES